MAHLLESFLASTPRPLLLLLAALSILPVARSTKHRFYPDDPIAKEPPPISVGELRIDTHTDAGAMVEETLHQPGKNADTLSRTNRAPALDINTIDEVPDSDWYTNRHDLHPLTNSELALGPGGNAPPTVNQPWTIVAANEGMTPIFRIQDSSGRAFALRFDPKGYPERTTGADVAGSHILHAIGYNVPDNYAVRFDRRQLRIGSNIRYLRDGQRVTLRESDVDHLLSLVTRYPDGTWRALASRLVDGELLGPFSYAGTRDDDPNDIFPHDHRRVLRALFVFSAWLDHADTRTLGTLDTIQSIDGIRRVRHFLTDFGSSFGSASLRPDEAWEGHTYAVDLRWGLRELLTLGAYSPKWERTHPRILPGAGRFVSDTFDPAAWKPTYPNPAFDNRTVADCFWAAKQIKAFTDDQLAALVRSGQYSDPKTVDAIVHTLVIRRDKIAAYYFAKTLPLDGFEVREGTLGYRDLGGNGHYSVVWSRYDNDTDKKSPLDVPSTLAVPRIAGYLAADIGDGSHQLTVYVHDGRVVGVTR